MFKNYFKTIQPWLILSIPAFFYVLHFGFLISPEFFAKSLAHSFDINSYQLSWLASAYTIAYIIMQIPAGLLLDRTPTHRILAGAMLLFAGGLWLFAATDWYWLACLGRSLTGIAGSFAFLSALKLANEWLPADKYTLAVALLEIAMSFGAIVAAFSFTEFQTFEPWRTLFFQSAVGLLVCALIAYFFVRDGKKSHSAPKAVNRVYYRAELLRSIKLPQLWTASLYLGLIFVSLFVLTNTWQVPILNTIYHIHGLEAVTVNSMVMIGFIAGALHASLYGQKFGIRRTLIIAAMVKMLAFIGSVYTSSEAILCFMLLVNGFTIGLALLCFTLVRQYVVAELQGFASAVANMLCIGIGSLFVPLFGYLLLSTDKNFYLAVIPLYIANVLVIVVSFYIKEAPMGRAQHHISDVS